MPPTYLATRITPRFGAKITASLPDDKHPRVHLDAADWREVAEFIYGDPQIKLDWLANLSGVDYVADDRMCVVYDLYSFDHRHEFAVKVYMPRDNPHVATVCDLWRAADWHEREAYDMFGIVFDNHPDLRRILCADDRVGFPLLKDYVFPREYHGFPGGGERDGPQQADNPK